MTELPDGTEVAKLEVEPGDFLVVQSQDLEQAQAVKEQLEALFPAANVVIVPAGVSLSVVRQIDRHRDCVTRTELEKMLAPEEDVGAGDGVR